MPAIRMVRVNQTEPLRNERWIPPYRTLIADANAKGNRVTAGNPGIGGERSVGGLQCCTVVKNIPHLAYSMETPALD